MSSDHPHPLKFLTWLVLNPKQTKGKEYPPRRSVLLTKRQVKQSVNQGCFGASVVDQKYVVHKVLGR